MANLLIPVLMLAVFGCGQVLSSGWFCAICTGKANYNQLVDGCFGEKMSLAFCDDKASRGCYSELKINVKSKTVEIERGCTQKEEQNTYTTVNGDVYSIKRFFVELGSNCNSGNWQFLGHELTIEQRKEYEAAVKDWKNSGCDWEKWEA
ncbi:hypothetical protein HELRODRAFT_183344 [Helobdella robusta]|uniref:Uncharacterized protein n=1 Tax=Helobdella robusta TaxID=6412 RepID=T1FJH3_HELRO|nr:hypothetical protein HELRODRAFT_183344 [Helobdella robusta]ESO11239.1 hypothetical protein HELRODRAFT_183344 [Helobdella robusta]